ncbi:MAG: hypothetical protein II258_07850, partial [Spirochaetales bacterium]|nr:hypothetical protein [Spirochaetales bacterium]
RALKWGCLANHVGEEIFAGIAGIKKSFWVQNFIKPFRVKKYSPCKPAPKLNFSSKFYKWKSQYWYSRKRP